MENYYLCLAKDAYQYCADNYFQTIYGKMYHKQALNVICAVLSKKEGEFDFKESIEWMKTHLDSYDVFIRIPIKRLFYMIDSYMNNGKFTTVSFTFYDNNSHEKKNINKEELKLIGDYIKFKGFSVHYHIENFLVEFLWFVDIKCKGLKNVYYDNLIDYYHYLLGAHTPSGMSTIIGAVHGFLLYCYDMGVVKYKSLCFMCHKLRFIYFDHMKSILKDFKKEFDIYGNEGLLIDTNDRECFDKFLQLFINEGYKGSKIKCLKIHLGFFYLFLDYTGYRMNPTIIRLWCCYFK